MIALQRMFCAAGALFLCATQTSAGGEDPDVLDAANRAPSEAEFTLIIENAAEIRRGPAGRAWTTLIASLFSMTKTADAWAELADRLELDTDTAFDRMLGQRVIFVWSGLESPVDWALLSDVAEATEARLRRKLDLAPRKIIADRPVLSLEHGRFQLSIGRSDRGAALLLGPSNGSEMFDRLARSLGGDRVGGLAGTPEFRDFRDRLGPPEGRVLVFARLPEGVGRWAGAMIDPDGLKTNIRYAAKGKRLVGDTTRPISMSRWRELAKGSLVAVTEPSPDRDDAAKQGLPVGLLPRLRFGEQTEDLWGGRLMMTLRPGESAPLAVAAGVEVERVDRIAEPGDAAMASLASWLRARFADDNDSRDLNFGGMFPSAPRSISITRQNVQGDVGGVTALFGPNNLSLHWGYRPLEKQDGDRGWWVVASEMAALRHASEALTAPEPNPGRWLTIGSVHPAALLDRLQTADISLPKSFYAIGWIEHVCWRLERVDESVLQGRASISLRADPEQNPVIPLAPCDHR